MEITFVTSNQVKFEIAKMGIAGSKIRLLREELEVDEIQSTDIEEIASKSADIVYSKINKSIAVSDAGFYIEALNGFPGPLVKYANYYLDSEDILRLMEGIDNRKIMIRDCLHLIVEGKKYSLVSEWLGVISNRVHLGSGTTFERIVIPSGHSKALSEFSLDEQIIFWANNSPWKKVDSLF